MVISNPPRTWKGGGWKAGAAQAVPARQERARIEDAGAPGDMVLFRLRGQRAGDRAFMNRNRGSLHRGSFYLSTYQPIMPTYPLQEMTRRFGLTTLCIFVLAGAGADAKPLTAAALPAEGDLAPHVGKAGLELVQVFKRERFPNIVVAVDGTLVATFGTGSVRARRSSDGGATWGDEITISKPGFQCGGLTVNEGNGDIFAFVEDRHPPAPLKVFKSTDHGKTWSEVKTVIKPDSLGNMPSMHMNDRGITLRHGAHKGRIIRPSRWYAGQNARGKWPEHYTNAIYSDDGGKTWETSDPFPAKGTGEATIAELSDGTVYYNSRRHWAQEGADPRRRWTAISKNGGKTWEGLTYLKALPDGPQNTNYGCMAGLARLNVRGRDIILYSNCDSPAGRKLGTVWASFDGGKTWPVKRLIFEGAFAYSSMTSGRPGTKTEGMAYVHFEGGPKGGSTVARFNLSWVLEGKETGDGTVPGWVREK